MVKLQKADRRVILNIVARIKKGSLHETLLRDLVFLCIATFQKTLGREQTWDTFTELLPSSETKYNNDGDKKVPKTLASVLKPIQRPSELLRYVLVPQFMNTRPS